jgi:hypothetical protein
MLRRCFPPSLRDALEKLPETVDETYERILLGIDKEKREYAHRLLQCVAVAIRPFRVKELAEVLAMRFDSGDIPDYHIDWRQEDSREAVLSAYSSLVAVVNVDGSSIVQFSHFSVKEYLSSHRLAEVPANLSRYHIDSLSAHTIPAQASLSILLHLDDSVDRKTEDFPFATYAAQHWVDHGRIEGVSSRIQDAMERLFGADNPSFATWLWIYDFDYPLKEHMFTPHPERPEAVPYTIPRCVVSARSLNTSLLSAQGTPMLEGEPTILRCTERFGRATSRSRPCSLNTMRTWTPWTTSVILH